MKWQIPAKTFLLGEYAALAQESAIILTTSPCFELNLSSQTELDGIHPHSPAGLWWQQQKTAQGLSWFDPYQGLGGLGASSAQFLGSYLASQALNQQKPSLDTLLEAYYSCAWSGEGLRPSGYDVLAQSQTGCVFINKKNHQLISYDWVFKDLSFIILHTGIKLATHQHLQNISLPQHITELSAIVEQARLAFEHQDSSRLIFAINHYHESLKSLDLVATHSLNLIEKLKDYPEVLAIKGCGALGADTVLILSSKKNSLGLIEELSKEWLILATEKSLEFNANPLIE